MYRQSCSPTILIWTPMPRRTDRKPPVALVATMLAAVVTAVATGAALAGETPRDDAQAWRTAFDSRVQVPLGERMIVVLAAPSLADRVTETGRLPSAAEQRRLVRRADTLQRRLLATVRARGIRIERGW